MEKDIYTKLFELKNKEITLVKDTSWYNYKYANLLQIQDKLWPIFKELNLVVIHSIKDWKVVTEIRDLDSNTYVQSELEIWLVESKKIEKFVDVKGKDIEVIECNSLDPQWVGSVITYYRRYNLLALLDLEQEDDDWRWWSNKAKVKDYNTELYIMTVDDVENKWNWKIYWWRYVYIDEVKKVIWKEQIAKLEKHIKFIPSDK